MQHGLCECSRMPGSFVCWKLLAIVYFRSAFQRSTEHNRIITHGSRGRLNVLRTKMGATLAVDFLSGKNWPHTQLLAEEPRLHETYEMSVRVIIQVIIWHTMEVLLVKCT